MYRVTRIAVRFILNLIHQFICYYYFRLKRRKLKCNTKTCQYVISFTSFPARMNKIWMVVESMLNQKEVDDDYILVLYLSKEQFPNEENDLPTKIRKQMKRGLLVKFMPGNMKSHKKYIYAFREYADRCIITIDDDLLYLDDFLRCLINAHKKYPNLIIANRAREIINGKMYLEWPLIYRKNLLLRNVLTTNGAGTLFPPGSYESKYINENLIKALCFYADDLWLSFICRLKSSEIYYLGENVECVELEFIQQESLNRVNNNVYDSANDKQIASISNWAKDTLGFDFNMN